MVSVLIAMFTIAAATIQLQHIMLVLAADTKSVCKQSP